MFGSFVNVLLSPVTNALDILEGLTEGEIRQKAIGRFGAHVVLGLTACEIVELFDDD